MQNIRICPRHQTLEIYTVTDGDYYYQCGHVEYSSRPLPSVSESKLTAIDTQPMAIVSGYYDFEGMRRKLGVSERTARGYIASGISQHERELSDGRHLYMKDTVDGFAAKKQEEPRWPLLVSIYGDLIEKSELVPTHKAAQIASVTDKWMEELIKGGIVSGFTSSRPFVANVGSVAEYRDRHRIQ